MKWSATIFPIHIWAGLKGTISCELASEHFLPVSLIIFDPRTVGFKIKTSRVAFCQISILLNRTSCTDIFMFHFNSCISAPEIPLKSPWILLPFFTKSFSTLMKPHMIPLPERLPVNLNSHSTQSFPGFQLGLVEFNQNCKSLPSNLLEADCSIFTLLSVVVVMFCHH